MEFRRVLFRSVQLDDNEAHYARVILDEVFGRKNSIADVTWQKSYAVRSNAEFVSTSTEHLLWYCRNRSSYHPNKFPRSDAQTARFSNPDDDPRGPWQSITFTISLIDRKRVVQGKGVSVSVDLGVRRS